MSSTFHLSDEVATVADFPDVDLRYGQVGTVVYVYALPGAAEAYDIRFDAPDGSTREVTLAAEQLAKPDPQQRRVRR